MEDPILRETLAPEGPEVEILTSPPPQPAAKAKRKRAPKKTAAVAAAAVEESAAVTHHHIRTDGLGAIVRTIYPGGALPEAQARYTSLEAAKEVTGRTREGYSVTLDGEKY